MKYYLEICYRQNIEPEYPMGDPEEFESFEEFLDFNYEQIDLIVDDCPEMKEVKSKLQNGDYTSRMESDTYIITVSDIDYR